MLVVLVSVSNVSVIGEDVFSDTDCDFGESWTLFSFSNKRYAFCRHQAIDQMEGRRGVLVDQLGRKEAVRSTG